MTSRAYQNDRHPNEIYHFHSIPNICLSSNSRPSNKNPTPPTPKHPSKLNSASKMYYLNISFYIAIASYLQNKALCVCIQLFFKYKLRIYSSLTQHSKVFDIPGLRFVQNLATAYRNTPKYCSCKQFSFKLFPVLGAGLNALRLFTLYKHENIV